MALVNKNMSSIYDGLIHKFLYKNDINSIHILLNLYDIESNITNICPKYITISKLKKRINNFLKERKDNHFISLNLSQLIHDEINRLELYIYLEGYKYGYYNNYWVNKVEKITLKNMCVEKLYDLKYLYHFGTNIPEIIDVKKQVSKDIHEDEKANKFLYDKVVKYSNTILKRKVLNLNSFLDRKSVV